LAATVYRTEAGPMLSKTTRAVKIKMQAERAKE
jgi:hypothetical protein